MKNFSMEGPIGAARKDHTAVQFAALTPKHTAMPAFLAKNGVNPVTAARKVTKNQRV
jgi:hypothetical protein